MAQYINREKLLKRMEGYCKANCGCKPYEDALCPSCGLGDAIYMVEEQRIVNSRNMRGRKGATVALSKTGKTTQWIPVTERLPDKSEPVLAYVYWSDYTDNEICYGQYIKNGRFRLTHYVEGELIKGYEVKAWMPIPEPPKEGK